jgi:hypothetical protein
MRAAFGRSDQQFKVPDLRGRFLRRADQATNKDPDARGRSSEIGGKGGDNVGSVQEDMFRSHTHGVALSFERRTVPTPSSSAV